MQKWPEGILGDLGEELTGVHCTDQTPLILQEN